MLRTQDIGHLVLEVLGCNQGVQELSPTLDHGVNFAAAPAEMGVVVEGLPQVVNGLPTGLRPGINEDTDFRLLQRNLDPENITRSKHAPPASCRWH